MNTIAAKARHSSPRMDYLLIVVGALMAAVGFLFAISALTSSTVATVGTSAWTETPCVIVSSEVLSLGGVMAVRQFEPLIRFRYTVDKKEYMSNLYTRGVRHYDNKAAVRKIVDQYPPGTNTSCYVNPKAPQEAVLTKSVGDALPRGGYGLIIGLVGMSLAWTGRRRRRAAQRMEQEAKATPTA